MGWWPWGKKNGDAEGGDDTKQESPPNVHGLADLARGMQHVAQSTQDILGQHYVNVLNHYFDEETGEPIEKRLKLPSGHVLDIPLIALVPPSTLQLKRLKIRMAVSLAAATVKAHKYDSNMKEIDRASLQVSFGPQEEGKNGRKNKKMMDIEMEFEARDPPEMVNRIMEWFTDMIQPQDPAAANKYGIPNRKGPDGTQILHHGAEPPTTAPIAPPASPSALEPEDSDPETRASPGVILDDSLGDATFGGIPDSNDPEPGDEE